VLGSLKLIVVPWHIAFNPVIACGNGFTVIVTTVIQPVAVSEYVICAVCATAGAMITPPVVRPPTTVATVELLVLHTPPGVISLNCEVSPEHIVVLPCIAAGTGFTVITTDWLQPVPIV
jgi:hypothetical protein